jgi:hypothetical protein
LICPKSPKPQKPPKPSKSRKPLPCIGELLIYRSVCAWRQMPGGLVDISASTSYFSKKLGFFG